MFYWFTWALVKFVRIFFFPMKVYGVENIPKKGSFIFASNHRSYLDPMVIPISCTRRLNFVAKEELFRNKVLNFILTRLEAFPIKKKSSDIRAIKEIFKRLKEKGPVLIFPQGTRVIGDEEQIEAGVGLIALKSGVPVIPVYVSGSDKVLPPESKKLNRHLITVTYGKPIQFKKGDSYLGIAQDIMREINSLSKT